MKPMTVPCICGADKHRELPIEEAAQHPERGVHTRECAWNAYIAGTEASLELRDELARSGKTVTEILDDAARDDLVDLLGELDG